MVGSEYEELAAQYLINQGMSIIEKNYRTKYGEIDLIVKDNQYYVFCEVKYRSCSQYGYPSEAVHTRKQLTIKKVAQQYLLSHHMNNVFVRFDVISILGNRLEHIPNAF